VLALAPTLPGEQVWIIQVSLAAKLCSNDWFDARLVKCTACEGIGSMDGLRGALETLVASFDAETLQGQRKMWRELADLLRKRAAEPITPK